MHSSSVLPQCNELNRQTMNLFINLPKDILQQIFSFQQIDGIKAKVMGAVRTRNIGDLYFVVGRDKALVPKYLTEDDTYSEEAGCSIMLPVLHQLGFKMSNSLFTAAARNGNLEMLKWLWKETDCQWDERTFPMAAERGRLDVCQWLRRKRCPWDALTFFLAAGTGNMKMLMWLKENGCDWDVQTYYRAIQNGHLEVVKWLKANGCPWEEQCFLSAVTFEKLDIMEWLFDNQCPWDERAYEAAVEQGNPEIISWLEEHFCPGS